jgi:hypothetical protein
MVEAALDGLHGVKDHITKKPLTQSANRFDRASAGDVFQEEPKRREVYHALAKYFGIQPSQPDYLRYVSGIMDVYKLVKAGFDSPYEIVLFDPQYVEGATGDICGYVKGRGMPVSQAASPIRRHFGFTTEANHLPWKGNVVGRRMHISVTMMNSMKSEDSADEVARIIVHEATHKFALTVDVLYKHQSFDSQLENDKLSVEDFLALEYKQPEIRMPQVPGKVIRPLAGADKDFAQYPSIRLLENADSYAWTARRLWKRFRPGK